MSRLEQMIMPPLQPWKVLMQVPMDRLCFAVKMAYLHSQIPIPIPIPVVDSLGLKSESNSVQCEKSHTVKYSHLVCSPNRNRNPYSGM